MTRLFFLSKYKIWALVFLSSACQLTPETGSEAAYERVKALSEKTQRFRYQDLDSAMHYNRVALALVESEQLESIFRLQLLLDQRELFDRMGNIDSANQVLIQAEALVSNESDPYQKALLNYCKGVHHFNRYQYQLAEQHLPEAAAYFIENPSAPKASYVFYNLGLFYERTGQLPRSQDFFLKAANAFANSEDTLNQTSVQIQLARLYREQQLTTELQATLKPLADPQFHTLRSGLPYKHLQQLAIAARDIYPDSALVWQQKAAQLSLAAKDSLNYHISLTYAADLLPPTPMGQNQLLSSLAFFENKKENSHSLLAIKYLVRNLLAQKQIKEAETLLNKGLQIANELNNPAETIPILAAQQDLFEKSGKTALAIQTRDLILNAKQELLKKNAATTLEFLTKAQNLQQVNHQKSLLSASLELQRKKILFRNSLILVLLIAGIILLIGARKIYLTSQTKKNATQILLESYKKELEQLNRTPAKPEEDDPDKELSLAKQKLMDLMEKKQLFLEPTLKVEDILDLLGITYKELQQVLKTEDHTNFKNFLNIYRIDHAKKLLTDPECQHLTIEGIGLESGFGSKQSFYKTFQQMTGVTPGEFKQLININP